jgi:hypothetical protein
METADRHFLAHAIAGPRLTRIVARLDKRKAFAVRAFEAQHTVAEALAFGQLA